MTINARDLSFWHKELGDWYAASGDYELLIGHASDDIKKTAAIHFTTAKLLPLHVTGATTMGELLADPRTAPALQKMMQDAMKNSIFSSEENLTGSESDKAMMEAMMTAMPLKSLISFGVMTLDQADGLIAMLNGLVQ